MKYLLSVIEQGSGAALSFLLSLWLIRGNGADAYGVYIFWFSAAIVTNSLQNALTIAHLFPLPPGPEGASIRHSTEELLLHVTLLFTALSAVVAGIVVALMRASGSELAEPAVIFFVPAYLLWQYARALAFTRGDATSPVAQAGVISMLTASLIGAIWLLGWHPSAALALASTGIAYAVAGAGGLAWLSRTHRLDVRWARLRAYRALLSVSRWPFLGAVSVEVSSRLYNFLVASWFGPAALGLMSATQVMLRPATLLTGAWMPVARAEMSGAASKGDGRGFLRSLILGSVAAGGITLGWGALVAWFWPQIDQLLYQGRFAGAGSVALLWTIQLTLSSTVLTVGVALQSLAAFRPLALAELAGAVVSGVAMTAFAALWGPDWCLVGMMIGNVVQVAAMVRVVPRELRIAIAHWLEKRGHEKRTIVSREGAA